MQSSGFKTLATIRAATNTTERDGCVQKQQKQERSKMWKSRLPQGK